MQGDGTGRNASSAMSDGALWQHSRATDAIDDESERLLDLAGYADGRLEPDERERIAEWLELDPGAASDIAAARALAPAADQPAPVSDTIVARAAALVGDAPGGQIVVFPAHRQQPRLQVMARWGSLAAAMVVAGWLGFTLGVDTSRSFSQAGSQAGDDGFLRELLDPATGFMRDLTEGSQT
jgi:anti-sigma factor RsiW